METNGARISMGAQNVCLFFNVKFLGRNVKPVDLSQRHTSATFTSGAVLFPTTKSFIRID